MHTLFGHTSVSEVCALLHEQGHLGSCAVLHGFRMMAVVYLMLLGVSLPVLIRLAGCLCARTTMQQAA